MGEYNLLRLTHTAFNQAPLNLYLDLSRFTTLSSTSRVNFRAYQCINKTPRGPNQTSTLMTSSTVEPPRITDAKELRLKSGGRRASKNGAPLGMCLGRGPSASPAAVADGLEKVKNGDAPQMAAERRYENVFLKVFGNG